MWDIFTSGDNRKGVEMYVFVVDIDGTVADTRPRIDAISAKYNIDEGAWGPEQVDEFTQPSLIKLDEVLPGAEIVPELARRCGAKLIFLTGRSKRARRATKIWLQNKLDIYDSVPLVMREEGDYRPTPICKEDIFLQSVQRVYEDAKFVFFEDDEDLLKIYSKYGLALKAPECWDVIRFLKDEFLDESTKEK